MGTAGTARCREAVSKLSQHFDVVVNIQVRFGCCRTQSGCVRRHPAPPRPSLRPVTGCCREMSPSSVSAAQHACPYRSSGQQRAPALLIARRCGALSAEPQAICEVVSALQQAPDAVYRWGCNTVVCHVRLSPQAGRHCAHQQALPLLWVAIQHSTPLWLLHSMCCTHVQSSQAGPLTCHTPMHSAVYTLPCLGNPGNR